MRVGYALKRIAPANRHFEFPAHGEIKELCEACFQALVGQQRAKREAGQRLVLEDEPQKFRHPDLKALNVERPSYTNEFA